MRKINFDEASFSVEVEIFGYTNIVKLSVAYLAIDPNIPHHLNAFDNVPINSNEPLSNITEKQNYPTSYTGVTNYTLQC